MLTKRDRDLLQKKLAATLASNASAQNVVTAIFTTNAQSILEAIPTGAPTHLEIAAAVVSYCIEDRWARVPSLLEVLLEDLITRGMGELLPIRAQVAAKIDPNMEVLTTSWIKAEKPFFGRPTARDAVKALLNSGDKPILMVQGLAKSGKTYTGDWLDFLSDEERCGFRFVIESLEAGSGPSMAPEDLAESLVAQMGRPIDKMPARNKPHRYEKRLCNWIVSEALQAPGRTWIVLDGFDDPDLDRDTKALIQELARSVLSGDLNRRVRLVLVDYKSELAQVDLPRLAFEALPDPETVQSTDLRPCLQQHFKEIGQNADDAFLTGLADKILLDTRELRKQPQYKSKPLLSLLNQALYQLRPFERLAGPHFAGRARELDELRSFVGILEPETLGIKARDFVSRLLSLKPKPALNIFGPGGIGKSALLMRFFLEHFTLPADRQVPFAYLDFDSPFLNINNLSSIAAEIFRQLALQFPGLTPRTSVPPSEVAGALAELLERLSSSASQPFLLVLDTFEEVQYGGEARAFPFWDLLNNLQSRWPFLRVLICGRVPVTSFVLAGSPPRPMELKGVDDEAAAAILAQGGVKSANIVTNRAAGLTALAALTELPKAVISKEAIIHQDDTVDLRFVRGCLQASAAVAKVVVARYDNAVQKMLDTGAPCLFNGTGWLLKPDLLITNHHVINSRTDGEAVASPTDFERQAREASIIFDYDAEGVATIDLRVAALEAQDQGLDYCILRLSASAQRNGLPLAGGPVTVTATTYLPLNVIQHPLGKAKRFALRNNLAVAADEDLVRYYTDTDAGSSGSPVLDDQWRVVALHRGAVLQSAMFQGKDTAFVNVGSQISRIVDRLKTTKPALYAELA